MVWLEGLGRGCRRSVPHRLTTKTLKPRQLGHDTRRGLLPDWTPRSSGSCSSAEISLISAQLQLADNRGDGSCHSPRGCKVCWNTRFIPSDAAGEGAASCQTGRHDRQAVAVLQKLVSFLHNCNWLTIVATGRVTVHAAAKFVGTRASFRRTLPVKVPPGACLCLRCAVSRGLAGRAWEGLS